MKVLNLYSGIGGNRKLWQDVDVVAVEFNPEIAAIYQEYFPNDTVVVADAHQYLLDHYKEFDFIWSSPPCQTHSSIRLTRKTIEGYEAKFPDSKLWQEIIFLRYHAVCPYVIENVKPYYEPFLKPSIEIGRHLFWSNVGLKKIDIRTAHTHMGIEGNTEVYGYKLSSGANRRQILRNLVNPEIGLAILDQIRGIKRKSKLKQISILEEV